MPGDGDAAVRQTVGLRPGLDANLRRVRTVLAGNRRQRGAERWLQANIALFLQGPGKPPHTPWSSLSTALESWRSAGRFEGAFFVRKEPGLRLRFWGDALTEKLEPELLVWLHGEEQRNQIRGFRLAVYEPEQHLFGGATGMALAHRQFNHDTRLALRYEALPEADRLRIPPHLLSLALLNDLFNRAVDDQGEVWDVWQRLRAARDVLPLPDPATDSQLIGVQAIAEQSREFVAALPQSIQGIVQESRIANQEIATVLRATSSAGRLGIGLRAWLMAVSIFNWNRLGLDPDQQIQIIGWMLQLYDPHAPRG